MAERIWVVVQVREGGLHPSSREAIAGAQSMAAMAGGEVEAIALGDNLDAVGAELATLDLACARVLEQSALASYTPGAYVGCLSEVIRAHTPDLVVFSHSYQSVDFVPRLAQELDAVLVPEVTSVRYEQGGWIWKRPVFAGKLEAEVKARKEGTVLASEIRISADSPISFKSSF